MLTVSNTHLVCVFSDVHFDNHHKGAWAAFREWHAEYQPKLSLAVGDLVDIGMMSRYDQSPEDPVYAVEQIQLAVSELNSINEECDRLIYIPGNHEERWEKAIFGNKGPALRGAKGLTLREQYYAQGLDRTISWTSETAEVPGEFVGKRALLVRHGHKQAGSWGTKNVASGNLNRFPTFSTVVGHHHRSQMSCRTVLGRTVVAIANPHLSGNHGYNTCPDWQRGFTVYEFYGRSRLRDCVDFTAYPVIMNNKGQFCWGGKVYGA